SITDFAAEQLVCGHAQCLCLRIQHGVLDCAHGNPHDASGAWPRGAIQLGVDALMGIDILAEGPRGEPVDDRAHARCTETFVELTPPNDASVRGDFDKMVVAPARIACQGLNAFYLHGCPAVRENMFGANYQKLHAKSAAKNEY